MTYIKAALTDLKNFLKLIRWFHELLGIFPFAVLYFLLDHYVQKSGQMCDVSTADFFTICAGVQLLMIPGFILNDIVDRHIDKINKPHTHTVDRTISLKSSKLLFIIFSSCTLLISVYISYSIFIEWAFISASVYILSLAYNLVLKRSPLFGNIAIACLAAFVPLVIMFFASDCLNAIKNERLEILIILYAAFPFLFIIPRELSLDISDMEGDRACGCKTLPILIGAERSKVIVMLMILLIIVSSFIVAFFFPFFTPTFFVMDVLLCIYIYKLAKTHTRIGYIRIGRFLWAIMILGLVGCTLSVVYL